MDTTGTRSGVTAIFCCLQACYLRVLEDKSIVSGQTWEHQGDDSLALSIFSDVLGRWKPSTAWLLVSYDCAEEMVGKFRRQCSNAGTGVRVHRNAELGFALLFRKGLRGTRLVAFQNSPGVFSGVINGKNVQVEEFLPGGDEGALVFSDAELVEGMVSVAAVPPDVEMEEKTKYGISFEWPDVTFLAEADAAPCEVRRLFVGSRVTTNLDAALCAGVSLVPGGCRIISRMRLALFEDFSDTSFEMPISLQLLGPRNGTLRAGNGGNAKEVSFIF